MLTWCVASAIYCENGDMLLPDRLTEDQETAVVIYAAAAMLVVFLRNGFF